MRKWAYILAVMMALMGVVLTIVMATDSETEAVKVHLASDNTNGFALFSFTNGTEHYVVINQPFIKIKDGTAWTNYFEGGLFSCQMVGPTEPGEETRRAVKLPPGRFAWHATVYCEVLVTATWKRSVNNILSKLNIPNVFRARHFLLSTPEYQSPVLALAAPETMNGVAAALKE